jgi:predicted metal-dependent phosphoesterase TrpH
MRSILVLAVLGSCGRRATSHEPAPAAEPVVTAAPDAVRDAAVPDRRRWIAGDLHMHVAPPDAPDDVAMSAGEIAEVAKQQHLEFVILTPHLWAANWRDAAWRRSFLASWHELAAAARATDGITLIPGAEIGVTRYGHFGVSGIELATLPPTGDLLDAAHAAGAVVVVNHPFALPTRIHGIAASHYDMSFARWTHGARGFAAIDGVEVWNLPLGLANLVSRPGGATGEARAFEQADRVVHTERRRVAVVGGTDNHGHVVLPTTWVLAADASEPAILAGLRAGATCVGGPQAGTLRARGDGDPASWLAMIGDTVRAAHQVQLFWVGMAELIVDGASAGSFDGGATIAVDAAIHTFRIIIGSSRSGFIYANL